MVVTIIVLIILAGVSIHLVLGDNGMITKAKSGNQEYRISQYIEKVELSRGMVAIEHEGKAGLDDLIEQIYTDKIVPEGYIRKLTEEKAEMLTEEGYIFIITADSIEYVGKGKASEKNLSISEAEWNEGKASVTITKGEGASASAIVQYQVNGTDEGKWQEGTSVGDLKHNDIVYARLYNGTDDGGLAIRAIKDKVNAFVEIVSMEGVPAGESTNVTIVVKIEDYESGIDVSTCKWDCTKELELGKDANRYQNNFEENKKEQTITFSKETPGMYYLHILTQDKVGNIGEFVSEPIEVNKRMTEMTLNKTSTTIRAGATDTLTVKTVAPEEATNKKVTWSTSNAAIATVEDGVVTGKAAGSAVITATAQDGSNVKASCNVTVLPAPNYLIKNGVLQRSPSVTAHGGSRGTENGGYYWAGGNTSQNTWNYTYNVNLDWYNLDLRGYTTAHVAYKTGQFWRTPPSEPMLLLRCGKDSNWGNLVYQCAEANKSNTANVTIPTAYRSTGIRIYLLLANCSGKSYIWNLWFD